MIQRLYTHSTARLKWLEYYPPRLEEEGKISSVWFNGEKVYQLGKKKPNKAHIPHDQICGRALLRIKDSVPQVRFYSERQLRGLKLGAVPEWAAVFPSGSILFFEYSTSDNFSRKALMKNKVEQYLENLERIESYFDGWGIVLFIIDAPRHEVELFAKEFPDEAFYFVDLFSFMDAGKCDQLDAPIYIWGFDGGSYPLS
jgi:hypothetical protein